MTAGGNNIMREVGEKLLGPRFLSASTQKYSWHYLEVGLERGDCHKGGGVVNVA